MRKIIPLLLFLSFIRAGAQSAPITYNKVAIDSLVSDYYVGQQDNLSLYIGRQFYGYSPFIEDHAFYDTNTWTKGSVLYDGLWYRNQELMYDIYADELIIKHPSGLFMRLYGERVHEFDLGGRTFVNLNADKKGLIKKGFYQRLTSGKATVYAKRVKILDEKTEGIELRRKFIEEDRFFIVKDGIYYSIRKQADLMDVLKDQRGPVHQYKSQLKLKFRKNVEEVTVKVCRYYNQL